MNVFKWISDEIIRDGVRKINEANLNRSENYSPESLFFNINGYLVTVPSKKVFRRLIRVGLRRASLDL